MFCACTSQNIKITIKYFWEDNKEIFCIHLLSWVKLQVYTKFLGISLLIYENDKMMKRSMHFIGTLYRYLQFTIAHCHGKEILILD